MSEDAAATHFFPVNRNLPRGYYTEIGKLISSYAIIESILFKITHHIVGVDHRLGRLTVLQRTAPDQLSIIQQSLKLKKIKLKVKWKTLGGYLRQAKTFRDRFAHGVWLAHPETKTPVLQDFSASYISNLEPGINQRLIRFP
jgi:hypothetical protein